MSAIRSHRLIKRLTASYLLAAVLFSAFPATIFAQAAISADIKANGADGTVTINSGEAWNYSWMTTGATACQLTSPSGVSGITLAGNDGPIASTHPWYPTAGGSTTLTLTCTDGTNTATDSVTITLASSGGAGAGAGAITVDIDANGSDGPVTITNGTAWNYSWTSTVATACQLNSPSGTSGITLAGNDGPISPGHPWYPAVGGSTTLTLTCTNGVNTGTDSVTINIAGAGAGGGAAISADIKINGADGHVTIANGTAWNYSWSSTGATACQLTSPSGVSGITLAGNDGPIQPGHPWYPSVASSTTLTLVCTNGTNTATDSASVGLGGAISADIKINGQDGTVTINNGTEWNYSWSSTGATACQLTSPSGVSGITLAGNDGPIPSGHPWYPAVGGSTTLTFTCTDGTNTAVDSATVRVVQPSSGGGGGGGSSNRSRGSVLPGEVLGTTTVANFCPFLTTYMRADLNNDPMQVIRLQAFLKVVEGHNNVTINGVFDQATLQAVHAFQQKYANEVLRPWGTNQSTGYVYVLTLAKINQILCGTGMPHVTPVKHQVVGQAKPVIDKEGGIVSKEGGTCPCKEGKDGGVSSGSPQMPVVGDSGSGSSTVVSGSNGQKDQKDIGRVAASIFSAPASGVELMQCIYEFLLIIVVLYIIGSVLENVLYKDGPENARKKFLTKWGVISLGLLLSAVAAYMIGEMCLVLPLIVAFLLSLAWMFLFPKRDALKEKTTTIMNRPSNTVTTTRVEEKRA